MGGLHKEEENKEMGGTELPFILHDNLLIIGFSGVMNTSG